MKQILQFFTMLALSLVIIENAPAQRQKEQTHPAIFNHHIPPAPELKHAKQPVHQKIQVANNPGSKRVLDSVYGYYWNRSTLAWQMNSIRYCTYNPSGNVVSDTYYQAWYGSLIKDFRTLYSYTGTNSYYTSAMYQSWDNDYYRWVDVGFTHYLKEDIQDEDYYKFWDVTHQVYTFGYRDTMWYDQAWHQTLNKIWENDSYSWNPSTSSWDRTAGYRSTSPTPDYSLYEYWNFDLNACDSISQTYNTLSGGKVTYSLRKDLQIGTNLWQNAYCWYYTYYSSGNQKEITTQFWNPLNSLWNTCYYTYYRDDSTGIYYEDYWKDYDNSTYAFTGGYRELNTFDVNNNNTSYLSQTWSTTYDDWVGLYRTTSTFDQHNLITGRLEEDWDQTLNEWYNRFNDVYYYSDFNNIAEKSEESKPCITVNPTSAGTSVACPFLKAGKQYRFTLAALTGQILVSSDLKPGETITFDSSLKEGLYMLYLTEDGALVYTEKMIIINR
ncbi:MAG: hypothetical protein NTU98_09205 [Bacteroidetes bacterium]|nr:hypothetical protein [Bacteroidota bacterium]